MSLNQQLGKGFESAFHRIALYSGYFVFENKLRARYAGMQLIKMNGNLDFTLAKNGKVGFFDAKTVEQDHFTYSRITNREHQLNLAVNLNDRGVESGFVFYFRKSDKVAFFRGSFILKMGKRTRFTPEMGKPLGTLINMDLSGLL